MAEPPPQPATYADLQQVPENLVGEIVGRLVATFGGDDVIRAEPFDAIALELGALWMR